ncbi:borealin-2-like [Protopterus annectens]|uniref:borealin-2-like n=1 Tax=Protopterus annectens TaxID=7888 RepID=UPI001CFA3F0C|nr:borealin-2-like [Protopterus annectens]
MVIVLSQLIGLLLLLYLICLFWWYFLESMAMKKNSRKRSTDSGIGMGKLSLSSEQRMEQLQLLLKQYDEEGRDRINEMKNQKKDLLVSAEKLFLVNLLRIPLSTRQTKLKDLQDAKKGNYITVADGEESLDDLIKDLKVSRRRKRKVKASKTTEEPVRSAGHKPEVLTPANGNTATFPRVLRTKSKPSNDYCNRINEVACTLPRTTRSTRNKAASQKTPVPNRNSGQSHGTSTKRMPVLPKVRSQTSLQKHKNSDVIADPNNFINISLTDGQTLCAVRQDLQEIDANLIDAGAIQSIHMLVDQLNELCTRASVS